MTDLDSKIKDAVNDEDQQLLTSFKTDDQLLLSLYPERLDDDPLFMSFKKGARYFTLPFWISEVVLLCIAIFCGWRLFQASEVDAMLGWGVALFVFLMMMLEVSVWLSVEISRIWTGRELRRIEQKLSEIDNKLTQTADSSLS